MMIGVRSGEFGLGSELKRVLRVETASVPSYQTAIRQALRALPQSTIFFTPSLGGIRLFDRPSNSRIVALRKSPDSDDLDDPDDWGGLCAFRSEVAGV